MPGRRINRAKSLLPPLKVHRNQIAPISAHDYGLGNSEDTLCFTYAILSFGLNVMAPLVLLAFLNRSDYDRCSKKIICV